MTGSCATWREQLPAFVGDDLPVATAAAVAAHLRGCLGCRREAASLQQARRALQSLAAPAAAPAGIDFGAMHAAIVAAATAPAPPRAVGAGRWWAAAAAAALAVGTGFWWVRDPAPQALLQRPPLVQPAALGAPAAVPWAGERMALRPLGFGGAEAAGAAAPGLLGRQALRTLDFTVPPFADAAADGAPGDGLPGDGLPGDGLPGDGAAGDGAAAGPGAAGAAARPVRRPLGGPAPRR